MSRKILIGILTCITVIVLSACGSNQSNTYNKKAPVEVEVNLVIPNKAKINQEIPLKAIVTQGNEKVKNADDVKFQIWEGDDINDSKFLDAKNEKNGTYSVNNVFDHDGVYQVQVHVDARDQHVMPKTEITIGNPKTKDSSNK